MPRTNAWIRLELSLLAAALLIGVAGCARRAAPGGPVQLLFATLTDAHAVAIFRADASGDARPLATIHEAPSDLPVDASVDLHGEVFIANANGTIKIYDGRNYHYERTREIGGPHTGMAHLTGMAVDVAGDIFVADQGARPGQAHIAWFAASLNGNIMPARQIMGPHTGLTAPGGIAIDKAGETFVVDRAGNRVLIFAADAAGDAAPIAMITDGLNQPRRVFVDDDLNVYVTNRRDDSVAVFVADGPLRWSLNARITSPAMRRPDGVTADSAGRIAVAAPNAVLFFAANANGSSAPKRSLQGPYAMNPTALLIR